MAVPFPRTFAAVAAIAVFGGLIFLVGSPLVPFVLAVVLAYICAPLVSSLERWHIGRALGATLIILALLTLLLITPLVLLPLLLIQFVSAVNQVPALFVKAKDWLLERLPDLGVDLPASWTDLTDFVQLDSAQLSRFGNLLSWFGEGISALVTLLGIVVITPLVTFYLLRDWPRLLSGVKAQLPAAIRPTIVQIASLTDQVLSQFLRGQLSVMAIMAVIYSLLLSVAGTPSALAVGFVTGLLCFIPYLGFLLGLVLALAVSFADFTNWAQILWTVLAMLLGTVLEGFVVTPRIIGTSVGLGPVAILLALTVMGTAFGFVGLLIAIPLASVLLSLWRYYVTQPETGHAV